jgi:hypothetical protein
MINSDTKLLTFLGELSNGFPKGKFLSKELGDEYVTSLRATLKTIDLAVLKERIKKECDEFPGIKKILEIAAGVKASARVQEFQRPTSFNRHDTSHLHCGGCYDTGLLFVIIDGADTLCRCRCQFGFDQDPRIGPYMETFERKPFPYKHFIPSDKNPSGDAFESLVMRWKAKKEIAISFWANMLGDT